MSATTDTTPAPEPASLDDFMRECGDACNDLDDGEAGCGGCSCFIAAPCGHCMRRSDEAQAAGLLS
jgi:hypothetical protein